MALKIIINAIGKITERELITLTQEYIKRTKWNVIVNEFNQAQEGSASINKVKEAKSLWPSETSASYIVALDEKGEELTSSEFAHTIAKLEERGINKLYFLLGGADGHDAKTLKNADLTISLGKMTMPHKLARLILIEQIYRAFTINTRHPYHR